MLRVCILLAASGAVLLAQPSSGNWRTDFSKSSVDLSEINPGGPPKDGIPALDHPQFVEVNDAARWLNSKEPVLVVENGGEARAYPLQILIWHELVNDEIGGHPILVSYCPLCNSAVVFDRRVAGKAYGFGVSGWLRNSDMIMYDRQTESWWQQITGDAIVGRLTGSTLAALASQTVSFETFARAFPRGTVLSRDTGYLRPYGENPYAGYEFGNRLMMPVKPTRAIRLSPLARIVAVTAGAKTRAYPFALLRRAGVIEDRVANQRIVVFFQEGTLTALDQERIAQSRDVGAAGVFSPELEGRQLSFQRKNGRIIDKETGSVWNVLGAAIEGPLAGKRLTPIRHGVYFAFAWLIFRPETEVVGESEF